METIDEFYLWWRIRKHVGDRSISRLFCFGVLRERTGGKAKIKARNERIKSWKLGKISRVNWMVYKHRKRKIPVSLKKKEERAIEEGKMRWEEQMGTSYYIILAQDQQKSAHRKKKDQRERTDSESVKMGLHIWNLIILGGKKKGDNKSRVFMVEEIA